LNFISVPGGGYNDKLLTMLAANEAPDVFIIRIGQLPEFLSKDLLVDLKPYIDTDDYDLSQFPDLAIEAYSHEGGIYGVPDNVATIALFYNQDMFEEAGAMPPTAQWDDEGWTVNDFFSSCEKLTKRDGNRTTQYAYDVSSWDLIWQIWVRIFGGQVVDDPFFPTECVLNEAPAVEALQFYADLRWEHGFAPRPDAMAEFGTDTLMQTGRLAMFQSGSWSFPNYRNVDFNVALGHFPTGKGGRANYVFYYPLVVPKTTEVPECAWNLLKFFNGPAMETIIKEGGLQGTTFEAQEKWFVTDPLPPANKQVMVDAARHFVAPDPVLTNWGEITNIMQSELDLLFIGEERDAKVVMDKIVEQVNPMILEGQWRS
ncbi:MAG: sugar ABC transporter substrate-binding protein, partial [Chloroflexi bacterium]|nr:sugar ABC transporter substrate-binding protein [Chloroflexota bacterium]